MASDLVVLSDEKLDSPAVEQTAPPEEDETVEIQAALWGRRAVE